MLKQFFFLAFPYLHWSILSVCPFTLKDQKDIAPLSYGCAQLKACAKVSVFSIGILQEPKYISSMNQKSLCARTWKPVDADSLVKLVVCDPLAISGRSGKLWKGNSVHFLVSLTQNQPVTKLIMSWILRVNCSGSGSWFPHTTSWRTWRPVPWDLSVLSDMSVARQEEWLELQGWPSPSWQTSQDSCLQSLRCFQDSCSKHMQGC